MYKGGKYYLVHCSEHAHSRKMVVVVPQANTVVFDLQPVGRTWPIRPCHLPVGLPMALEI